MRQDEDRRDGSHIQKIQNIFLQIILFTEGRTEWPQTKQKKKETPAVSHIYKFGDQKNWFFLIYIYNMYIYIEYKWRQNKPIPTTLSKYRMFRDCQNAARVDPDALLVIPRFFLIIISFLLFLSRLLFVVIRLLLWRH